MNRITRKEVVIDQNTIATIMKEKNMFGVFDDVIALGEITISMPGKKPINIASLCIPIVN